jgi:hypothetical protein
MLCGVLEEEELLLKGVKMEIRIIGIYNKL